MPKRKYDMTEITIERKFKEGCGAGFGSNYIPWLTINDFPSTGRSSRILGIKTNRLHHFFSDLEKNFFIFVNGISELMI